jgi:hypothetical protein
MSRAWMKDAAAQLPEHQAHHNQCSTASAAGWRRKLVRVSMLKHFLRRPQGPLGEAADQVGEALRPKSSASLPAWRVRFRAATPRSTASSGARASRLTTRNSQRSRTSASRAARRPPTPSTATPCSHRSRPPGDLPTQGRARARWLRFVAPQHRLSPHRVQAGHIDAVVARRRRHCRGRLAVYSASRRRVTPPSSTTSRARAAAVSPRCPGVRSSTSPTRTSGGARSRERGRVGAREDAAAATAATQAVSSEQ